MFPILSLFWGGQIIGNCLFPHLRMMLVLHRRSGEVFQWAMKDAKGKLRNYP